MNSSSREEFRRAVREMLLAWIDSKLARRFSDLTIGELQAAVDQFTNLYDFARADIEKSYEYETKRSDRIAEYVGVLSDVLRSEVGRYAKLVPADATRLVLRLIEEGHETDFNLESSSVVIDEWFEEMERRYDHVEGQKIDRDK